MTSPTYLSPADAPPTPSSHRFRLPVITDLSGIFELLEELRSPCGGFLAYWARSYPVRPGDWAFAVTPCNHPDTVCLDRSHIGASLKRSV